MPSDITIFAAQYLVYIDVVLAGIVVLALLYGRTRDTALWWVIAACGVAVLSAVGAVIASAMHNDPRPFTVDHVKPLIAHGADNGFPSDHALLAALIVAVVLILSVRWSAPFVVLAVLIDWARVGAGIHHVADVLGSSIIVAIATLIALALARPITRAVLPHIPPSLLQSGTRGGGAHSVSPPRR